MSEERSHTSDEWMEGGFFLIQHLDLGPEAKGMEVIGHERPLGQEPSADIRSRFYSNTGDTLDYTYQLEGDTLTIWFGDRGSPAYYEGAFSEDGATLRGPGTTPVGAATRRSRPGSGRKRYGYSKRTDDGTPAAMGPVQRELPRTPYT